MNFERELRRWSRLRPEILTRCVVKILVGRQRIGGELIDLSPGGIGLLVEGVPRLEIGQKTLVEIRFGGQPLAVRSAEVRRITPSTDGILIGLSWRMIPEIWNEIERRNPSRLTLPVDALFARTPLKHAHNVWTRLSVIDINSDFGFQVETRGGPAYLLPGHRTVLGLDLPHLHQHGWECQVMWVRPALGQGMRLGLRVLDPDPTLDEILSEWLQIRREWSPLELQQLGFGKDSLPGQYRFRKIEEQAEAISFAAFLGESSGVEFNSGQEGLRKALPTSPIAEIQLGCWDGLQLVAAITLSPLEDESISSSLSVITNFAIEPHWIVPEVFLGLWEQTTRLFLASESPLLLAWCPPGRRELFRLLGLEETNGPTQPSGGGTWMSIHRDRMISGIGMNAIRWVLLYANISNFVLQHQDRRLTIGNGIARFRRKILFWILRDWREPHERNKLRKAIGKWAIDMQETPTMT